MARHQTISSHVYSVGRYSADSTIMYYVPVGASVLCCLPECLGQNTVLPLVTVAAAPATFGVDRCMLPMAGWCLQQQHVQLLLSKMCMHTFK